MLHTASQDHNTTCFWRFFVFTLVSIPLKTGHNATATLCKEAAKKVKAEIILVEKRVCFTLLPIFSRSIQNRCSLYVLHTYYLTSIFRLTFGNNRNHKKNAALHNLNFKWTQQLLLKVLKQTINCEDFLHSITNKCSIKQPCTWYLHNCSVNLLVKLWLISVKCHGSCLFARLVLACGRTNTACCQL